jgi:hypothetical protein
MLNQVVEALKQSMVLAIQHGFLVVLMFCGAAFISVLFLKDLPLAKSWQESEREESGEELERASIGTPLL